MASAEQTTMQAIGLNTSQNELGAVPPGGLVKAENCVITAPGLVGSRRGHARLAYLLADEANAYAFFSDGTAIVQCGTNTLQYDTGSAFASFSGTYAPPDADLLRMRFLNAAKNLYLTSTKGVYRLDRVHGTPVLAGVVAPKDILTVAVNSTVDGWLGPGQSAAYRITLCDKDTHGNVYESPPCGLATVTNTDAADTFNTVLSFPLGAGPNYSTSMFFRVYRSDAFPGGTRAVPADAVVNPPDELFLLFERYFTSEDLSNALVTFTDTIPTGISQTPLYTDAFNGDGIAQTNDTPPLCKDLAWWDNRAWAANVSQRQAVTLSILGTGVGQDGVSGVRIGDVITIGGWSFTAASAYDLTSLTFKVFTDSLDAGKNIEHTTRSLINLINQNQSPPSYETAPTMRAQYLSIAANNTFGQFFVEAFDLDAEAFHVTLTTQVSSVSAMNLSRVAGTVTATTTAPHNLEDDDFVTVTASNIADAGFNGTFQINVTNSTTITYAQILPDATNAHTMSVQRTSPVPQFAWSPAPPPSYFDIAIGGLVRSGGSTVTVTTSVAHGLLPGIIIPIEPAGVADPNFAAGTYTVATVPSATSFTYTNAGTGLNVASTTAYRSGARVVSDPQAEPHVLNYSKNSNFGVGAQMPEAFPRLANRLPVGTAGKAILRIVPQGDYLYVFKEEGTYIVSYGSPYTVSELDLTYRLIAPDTAVACASRVIGLTNKGLAQATPGGMATISGPVEQDLFTYYGSTLDGLKVDAWGAARETDGLYLLGVPAVVGATTAPYNEPRIYVYSTRANAWTTWETPYRFALVRPTDDVLTLATPDPDSTLALERNTRTAADFADGTISFVVTSFATLPVGGVFTVVSSTGAVVGNSIGNASLSTTGIIVAVLSATTIQTSCGDYEGSYATPAEWEILFSGCVGTGGATIGGVSITGPTLGTDALTAAAFKAAVEANSTTNALVSVTIFGAYVQLFSRVTGASPGFTVVPSGTGRTLNQTIPGTNGDLVSYEAIPIDLKWRSLVAPSPAEWRGYREAHVHFRNRSFRTGTLRFTTDQYPTGSAVTLAPARDRAGTIPAYTADTSLFPGRPIEPVKSRVQMPNLGDAAYLNVAWEIREAFALWAINGTTIVVDTGSEKSQV